MAIGHGRSGKMTIASSDSAEARKIRSRYQGSGIDLLQRQCKGDMMDTSYPILKWKVYNLKFDGRNKLLPRGCMEDPVWRYRASDLAGLRIDRL